GLWMSGGNAPSVGLQGPGDPNPGQGKNRLVQPDLMERWQDSVFSFHIKDLGPTDQGTQVRNVGDEDNPGSATYAYGALTRATGARTRCSSRRSTSASGTRSATSTCSSATA